MSLLKLFPIDKFWYLVFMSFAAALGLAKFFFFSKLVSVEEFGLYSLVLSLYIFVVFIGGMGLQEGLLKKGAEKFANLNEGLIKKYFVNAIVYASAFVIIIGFILTLAVSIVTDEDLPLQLVLIGTILAFSAVLFNILDAYIRSRQKFTLFASLLFMKAVLVISLGYFLSQDYGAIGLLVAESLSLLIVFFSTTLWLINLSDFRLVKSHKVALVVILNGYQMMLVSVLRNAAIMLDKWFVALSVGLLAFGFYSFSMIFLSIALVSLGFIVTLKGPVWIAGYQKKKNPKLLFQNITQVVYKVTFGIMLLLPLTVIYLPDILQLAYPKYANFEVYWLFVIVHISILFIAPVYFYDWLFIATSNEKSVLTANILSLIFTFIMFLGCWILGASILVFAVAFLISRLFLLVNYFYQLYKKGFVCVS